MRYWNHAPTSVNPIPAKESVPPQYEVRPFIPAPQPAAIAAFMDTVRRLNNSVDFGEVEPAAGVWRWLEELAGGTLSVKAEVSEFDRGMMLVRHAVERLIDTDHAAGVDDRGIIDNILALLAVGSTR
jgi:hypothetical protein